MGKILPTFQKSVIEEIVNSIIANTSQYYAFGSNPIQYPNTVPTITDDDKTTHWEYSWNMLFGKKLTSRDMYPVINKNLWVSNTVYDRYNDQSNTLYEDNNFYVISEPYEVGGVYNIYKCIDNNGEAESTIDPGTIGTPTQSTSFTTSDSYTWRYIATVSSAIYDKFATTNYIPIYANSILASGAMEYSGVETIIVANTGSGYDSYSNGTVQGVVNTTLIQISNSSSSDKFFYNNNGIYIYNVSLGTSELNTISNYIANSTGKWVYLSDTCNTNIVLAGQSTYIISPKVVFNTDGKLTPQAYSVVNSFNNSVSSIVILDIGSHITRADVSLETSFGSGANLVPILPFPGGHGSNPMAELGTKGVSIAFGFSNTENSTILGANVNFNKIGLIKNPYVLEANTDKGARFSSNTFSCILKANVSPSHTFTQGELVIGNTSGAKGYVAFANSTKVYLTGDKHFINEEFVGNSTSDSITQIIINTLGDIYQKDITPLYVQNINNVVRSNTQNEFFKIIIQI